MPNLASADISRLIERLLRGETHVNAPEKQLLQSIIDQLEQLHRAYAVSGFLHNHAGEGQPGEPGLDALLQFASGLLRNQAGAEPSRAVRHVTVFGGTQVGKSTVVNILCGSTAARVHHTAGFTRHAQAFVARGGNCQDVLSGFPQAFPRFQCVSPKELSPERPREFGVAELSEPPAMPGFIYWDAPDCDAVDATRFQAGLLETATIADVVVYVTSREKYAVNAILKWLLLLRRAGVPVVGCLNMVPQEQQAELLEAMGQAIQEVAQKQSSTVGTLTNATAIEFLPSDRLSELLARENPIGVKLREQVTQAAQLATSTERTRAALTFLQDLAPQLTAPAIQQLKDFAAWQSAIESALNAFVHDYQLGYLDNPQRYDAFNRVGVEILALLNPPIPGLRKALVFVRTALSLPARAIVFGSRAIWRYFTTQPGSVGQPVVSNEETTLREANDRLLNTMGSLVAMHAAGEQQPFWAALKVQWGSVTPAVAAEFRSRLQQHRERTEEWVRETAQGIYEELARDPVKLNMLRTGRISADAAAILVSIHTGGHGDIVHDLLVTPAMMSLVEAISQHIASSYVEQRKKELRERLLADTQSFAEKVYGSHLKQLGQRALKQAGFDTFSLSDLHDLQPRIAQLRKALADA
jgi:GTPase Era involved in 16S rRNA processing